SDQSCAHAGATSVSGVATVTAAHGSIDAGTDVASGRGAGLCAGAAPHAATASSQAPISAVVVSPLTTSPQTLAAESGPRTPNGGAAINPSPWGGKHGSSPLRPVARTIPRGHPAARFDG